MSVFIFDIAGITIQLMVEFIKNDNAQINYGG